MQVLYPRGIGIWSVGFGRKTQTLGGRRGPMNSKRNPHMALRGPESNPGHIGGR